MNPFKHFINKAKDWTLQPIARWIANKYQLEKFGKMTTLRLDSEKKEIFVSLDLHGEQIPIELTIDYNVLTPTRLEIKEVRASREWVAALINKLIPAKSRQFDVPSTVITALSQVIR